MSGKNPDILIPSLKELIDHLKKWNYYASELLKESWELFSAATESTENSKLIVKLSENHVLDDSAKLQNEKTDINILKSKCELEKPVASKLLISSKSSLDQANTTMDYWEDEFKKVTDWISSATKRLEVAKNNFAFAKLELDNAKIELENAKKSIDDREVNLENSFSMKESPDVVAARLRHNNAARKYEIAKLELQHAEKNLNKATSCMTNYDKACKIAVQLFSNAKSAYNSANETNELTEKSLYKVTEADNLFKKADEINYIQIESLNETSILLSNQISLHDEVETIQSENLNLTNSSQDLVFGSIQDLERRIEWLIKFAQPLTNQKSVPSDFSIRNLFKNPLAIAGSLLIATLIFGPNAFLLTSGTLMSLLALGVSEKSNDQLLNINESGAFNRTGRRIERVSTRNWNKKEKGDLSSSEPTAQKSLEDKLVRELPLFSPEERKTIFDYQRLNHPAENYSFNQRTGNKNINNIIFNAGKNPHTLNTATEKIEPFIKNIDNKYYGKSSEPNSSLNEKVKNSAKEILINRSPFEMYYDPIGKAIDDAANKEFPGHCVLSPHDKDQIRKVMEYEKYQYPTYAMQSTQASLLNNNYNTVKPLYSNLS